MKRAKRGRKAQTFALKVARSAICLGEMHRLFPNARNSAWALERLVYLRTGSEDGISRVKGRFVNLEKRNGTPTEEDCAAVEARLEERCQGSKLPDGPLDNRLRKWINCPAWGLRAPVRDRDWCNQSLRSLSPDVCKIVFIQRSDFNPEKVPRRRSYDTLFYLVQLGTWDALVACLLIADENEVIGDPVGEEMALLCAYACFPKAVRSDPLLYTHWEKAARYLDPFWSPVVEKHLGGKSVDRLRRDVYTDDLDPKPLAAKLADGIMRANRHDDRVARIQGALRDVDFSLIKLGRVDILDS